MLTRRRALLLQRAGGSCGNVGYSPKCAKRHASPARLICQREALDGWDDVEDPEGLIMENQDA
jgi:hypothetical protein